MTPELTPDKYRSQLEEKYSTYERLVKKLRSLPHFDAIQKRMAETYIIDKVLAIGGTGIVHVGHHKRFHQRVAIKINRPNPNLRAEERSMVASEAKLLPKLSHRNIISVLDLGTLCDHKSTFCECEQHPKDCDHKAEECAETSKLTYIVEPTLEAPKNFSPIARMTLRTLGSMKRSVK